MFALQTTYKKEARVKYFCLSRCLRPSHCPWFRISNAEAHAYWYTDMIVCQTSGRGTLRYCGTNEVAKFKTAADKRCYTSLSICPAAHPLPLQDCSCPIMASAETTVQRYKQLSDWQNNFFTSPKKKVCPESIIQSKHIERDGSQIRILYVVFHNICVSNVGHLLALLVPSTHLKGAPVNNKIHKIVEWTIQFLQNFAFSIRQFLYYSTKIV